MWKLGRSFCHIKFCLLVSFLFVALYSTPVNALWTQKYDVGISDFDISADGDYIVASAGTKFYLYDRNGNMIYSYEAIQPEAAGAQTNLTSVGVSPNGEYFAFLVLDYYPIKLLYEYTLYMYTKTLDRVLKKTISRDGSPGSILDVSDQGVIVFRDTIYNKSGDLLNASFPAYSASGASVSVDGKYLAVFSDNVLRYMEKDKVLTTLPWDPPYTGWTYGSSGDKYLSIAISQDGKYIVAGDVDGYVYFLGNDTKLLWRYKAEGSIFDVAINTDETSSTIVAASLDGKAYYFDLEGKLVEKEKIEALSDAAFSATGNYLRIKKSGVIPQKDVLEYFETALVKKVQKILIVTNSIDYGLAGDFFGFLQNKGLEPIRSTAPSFNRNEKFIVILGGPDAPEGIGETVGEALTNDEQSWLREKGNRKMFVKSDVWTKGQVVIVIAGSDRYETQKAHKENQGDVLSKYR